jgi:serine protease SohB
MEFLYEYGLFLAQAVTLAVAILVVVGFTMAMGQRSRGTPEGHIEIRRLNDRYEMFREFMESEILDEGDFKAQQKQKKKDDKKESKSKKKAKEPEDRHRLYILDFDGDIRASATADMREEISAILNVATKEDEVLVKLESGGGMVHSYGLAASQLQRIKEAGVPLNISVDMVAASGGYMMACVGDRIMAAPFAIIGSIGVLAQLPNFHRLLKKANVDYEQHTAGDYKRTVTMFGENTDEDRAKLQQDLEDTHDLFKQFVSEHRPQLSIDGVATGEVWYGQQALDKGLIDELLTSDSYVQTALKDRDVFEVRHVLKKGWQEKLGMAAEGSIQRGLLKLWQQGSARWPL